MPPAVARARRFAAIWFRSGSARLAWEAMRNRCQVPVLEFLTAGGTVGRDEVVYRTVRLPRPIFTGPPLAGVAYLRRLVDFGATVAAADGGYTVTLPDRVRFVTDAAGLVDAMLMMIERFVDDEYAWIDVRDRVIVDVGANIGDSTVYFARRGARFVYGFEPDDTAWAAAQRNLQVNGAGNATVEHQAVTGAGDGGVAFAEVLRRAAREHPQAPIACKIDCEGCEFEILVDHVPDQPLMAPVVQLMIEYHHRPPDPIVASLARLGFEVEARAGAPGVGWVRAWRAGRVV